MISERNIIVGAEWWPRNEQLFYEIDRIVMA
jgi:hypothetical protein